LTQEKNYAQGSRLNPRIYVSLFNELSTERKTMLVAFVSFFNELSIERKTILMNFVSFFNELATERKNYAHDLYLIF
jgi:hypothetical protein